MSRELAATLGSLLAHGALIAAAAGLAWSAPVTMRAVPPCEEALRLLRNQLQKELARDQRAELVARARLELSEGRLHLGAFLLEAGRIDSLERGLTHDADAAKKRYAERLEKFKASSESPRESVPAVFGDLRYHGRPGGLMGDALLNRGGSCEQVSLLIVAVAHDAGRKDVALRYYGAAGPDGVAHVSPVLAGAGDWDLMAGRAAERGGIRVTPEELVEAYARAREPDGRGAGEGLRPTLIGGLPENRDAYPGAMPIYAERAVRGAQSGGAPLGNPQAGDAAACGYRMRTALLDPVVVHARVSPFSVLALEPYRNPSPALLDREAWLLHSAREVADNPGERLSDRLMASACLIGVGEAGAVNFTLAGEQELASLAVEAARAGKEKGKALMADWRRLDGAGRASVRGELVEMAGRTWMLLLIEGGDAVVLDIVDHQDDKSWGKVSSVAALLIAPSTRRRGLAMVEKMALDGQVDVMHEVYHAHDHMPPWASDFQLDPTGDPKWDEGGFMKAWRVFRPLAWGIWNGKMPVHDMLVDLRARVAGAGLGAPWEAAMLEYAARNILGLAAMRSPSTEPVRELRLAAERTGTAGKSLAKRLSYVESQGELTATTLADAWRAGGED